MKIMKQREAILNGNLYKIIITMSLPIMLNNLIQTVYNLTDTFFVSKIGGIQVAAITFVWPVIFLIMALGLGISVAGTAMISQYVGAHELDKAKETAGQIVSFSFFVSVILGIVGYITSPMILKLMGADGALLSEGITYLKVIFLGAPVMFSSFSYAAIKQAEGDTISPMIIQLISVGINIILDPIFIFTLNLGIRGAAIATVIARLIATLIIVYKLFVKNKGVKIDVENLLPRLEIIKGIVKIGLPASLGHSMTALGFVVLNILVVKFGADTMAALGVGNRINSLLFMPAMGIGSAMTSISGQNIGAKNYDRVKEAVIKSSILSLIYSTIGTIILIHNRVFIASIFTDNPEILAKCTYYLIFVALSVPPMGIFTIFLGVFQGAGHTVLSMYLSLSRLWAIRLPSIYLMERFMGMQEEAVWYAVFISNVLMTVVTLLIYMSGYWKKEVIKTKEVKKPV